MNQQDAMAMYQQDATDGAAVGTSGFAVGYRDLSLARPVAERAGCQEIDVRAVDTARLLAGSQVSQAPRPVRLPGQARSRASVRVRGGKSAQPRRTRASG
jgi:hypothetical protein